jgi:hypothetical protein
MDAQRMQAAWSNAECCRNALSLVPQADSVDMADR